jgi:hypothetical protein
MAVACHHAPGGAPGSHEIADGDRLLSLSFGVDWGDADLRDSHEKPLTFCSFACLAGWASEKSEQHDGRTLVEGNAA